MNNSPEQNASLFDILEDVLDKAQIVKSESDVTIPVDDNTVFKILKESEFGIYGNLPYEEVFEVLGHACVSLIVILEQMFAHRIAVLFTEQTDVPGSTHITSGRNGTPAMERFLNLSESAQPGKQANKLWKLNFVARWIFADISETKEQQCLDTHSNLSRFIWE